MQEFQPHGKVIQVAINEIKNDQTLVASARMSDIPGHIHQVNRVTKGNSQELVQN